MTRHRKEKRESISLRDYVDTRIAASDRAVILALETVKVAMDRDDKRISTVVSVIALVVSVAVGVFEIAKHV